MIMDELNRDLANGLLGEQQFNDALSGDLAGAYRDGAARDEISQQDPPGLNYRGQIYRERQPRQPQMDRGPLMPPATRRALGLLVAGLAVLLLLVALGVH
jgi:hypothetical protein